MTIEFFGRLHMNKLTVAARILLGLTFFISGLNGFLNFLPMPENFPENMTTFMAGLTASGYLLPLTKALELISGILLLTGAFVPLALVMLAPIVINIFFINAFMTPTGLPVAILISALEFYLAFFAKPYCNVINQLFSNKANTQVVVAHATK